MLYLFWEKIGVHISGELLASLTVDSKPLPAMSKIVFIILMALRYNNTIAIYSKSQ